MILPNSSSVRFFLAVGAALTCLSACRQPANPPVEPAGDLKPGKILQGRLSGERPALYRIALSPGEYVHVKLEQQGVDAVASLLDPDGGTLLAIDSLNGDRGPEHLFFVADQGGSYLVEARAFGDGRGRFLLESESRPATPVDRLRAAACRALSEADALMGTVATQRQALKSYEVALDGWRRSGEVFQEAMTEYKLGNASRAAGEEASAARSWERALVLFASLGIADPQPVLHNKLGTARERLGEVDAARSAFEAALASARRLGNRREETAAINNLGYLEQRAGEPWRALLLFEEALAGWRELEDARKEEAVTLHNLGTLYLNVGKLPEAQESLEAALHLYGGNDAAAIMELGWVRFLQGDPAGARNDLLRSLELRRTARDRRGEAVSLGRLGALSQETRELDRAVSEYRQALKIQEEIGDQQGRAHTLINLGAAFTAKGNPAAGLRMQNLALSALEGQNQPSAQAYALFRRAQANRGLGQLKAAWTDMQSALQRLEDIRARAASDDFRMSYLDWIHEQFDFAVDLLMELHEKEPGRGHDRLALDLSERVRARGLLDLVQDARYRRAAEQRAAASWRLDRLDEEIRAAEGRQAALAAEGGRRSAMAAEDTKVRRLLRERDKILVELRAGEARKGFSTRPLIAQEIQRNLDAGTVMLVYFLGEKRSFVWAIGHQSIESAELRPRALVEAAAERLHSLLTRSHLRDAGQLRLTAEKLSAELLGQIAHRLKGKRIVVVPDGALAYIPFAALPDPAGGGQPLLVRHQVSVAPSASVLAAIRERETKRLRPPRQIAALADPVFSREDPRVALSSRQAQGSTVANGDVVRSARDLGLRALERLPFSGREAEAILALVQPGQGFQATGFAANLPLVTSGRLEDFRIVHFATHALVHPQHPQLSGVVLSLVDERGRPRPGFLRSHQIHSLHLPAELVVLSACQTGLGLKLEGEGLVGLTQGFFNAGASRVIVSLWNVGDEATANLMERFYHEHLKAGRPPSAALREAQLSMLRDPRWSAPNYWAGFVLQGDFR